MRGAETKAAFFAFLKVKRVIRALMAGRMGTFSRETGVIAALFFPGELLWHSYILVPYRQLRKCAFAL